LQKLQYQARGRVGRGEHQSFCFLLTDSTTETTTARLNALIEAKNGFELAEKDLELRGPGQFLGERQTGMPDTTMSSLSDIRLVKSAKDSAQQILAKDPEHKHRMNIKNATYTKDLRPLDQNCVCLTCQKYSRSYLHHLFATEELSGMRLASIHNLHFLLNLMKETRRAIAEDRFMDLVSLWQTS
jgi:hypothetical protein